MKKSLRLVFVHPDLGIGGAERAVIDAALALKSRGHQVTFLTAHHDPSHCFTETVDGTLDVSFMIYRHSLGDSGSYKLYLCVCVFVSLSCFNGLYLNYYESDLDET